jgi:nucleotide-binding universal stress UspA family protein
MKIKRILVPVDFSTGSLQALDYAVDLAKPFGAELQLLFVLEPILLVAPDYASGQSSALAELINEQRRNARTELENLQARCAKRGIKVRGAMLSGRAADAIGSAAKRLKADLIVMATHGRTGVSRLVIGSVTERVVRTATCPVLTLHANPRRTARRPRTKPAAAA